MTPYILLVTWFMGAQMSSYQVHFENEPACWKAYDNLLRHAGNMRVWMKDGTTGVDGTPGEVAPSTLVPRVSAICTPLKADQR